MQTTRGFEATWQDCYDWLEISTSVRPDLNFELDNPLMRFLRGEETIDIYLELDDFSVWSGVKRIANGPHKEARELALRLKTRDHVDVLDLFSDVVMIRLSWQTQSAI